MKEWCPRCESALRAPGGAWPVTLQAGNVTGHASILLIGKEANAAASVARTSWDGFGSDAIQAHLRAQQRLPRMARGAVRVQHPIAIEAIGMARLSVAHAVALLALRIRCRPPLVTRAEHATVILVDRAIAVGTAVEVVAPDTSDEIHKCALSVPSHARSPIGYAWQGEGRRFLIYKELTGGRC